MCNKGGIMYKTITKYVLELGVKVNTKGFRYLIDAIDIARKVKTNKIYMFKDIYDPLAKKHHDTRFNVERALRYAFQNCNDIDKKYLSVGEFLSRVRLEKRFKGE